MEKFNRLPNHFIGLGEVKGFSFTRKEQLEGKGSLFEVNTGESIHFEVIKEKFNAKCVDFEKKIYSDNEFVESYPKSNRFGIDAWSYYSFESALKKLNSL
jgi:hypothetical protein